MGELKDKIISALIESGVTSSRLAVLMPVIENVVWMSAKLDEVRENIRDGSIVIDYDNGGGQKGIRENPYFKGYESLWKSYMTGMTKILDYIPNEAVFEVKEADTPKTVLELVRSKHDRVTRTANQNRTGTD